MRSFLQFTVSGLSDGAVYALLALSWVLIYRVSSVVFLIAGEFVVLGALMIGWTASKGIPLGLGIALTVLVAVIISLVIDVGPMRRLRTNSHSSSVVLLLGFAIVGGEVMRLLFGADSVRLASFLPDRPISLFGASVLPHQLLLIGITALLVFSLWLILDRTWFGKAMLACSQDPTGARLVGISPVAMRTLAFGIAGALGATAGILVAPINTVTFSDGITYTVLGFIAAAVGLWSFQGAVAAGIAIGLTEAYGAGYVSSVYKDVFPLALLLVALVIATLPFGPASIRRRLMTT